MHVVFLSFLVLLTLALPPMARADDDKAGLAVRRSCIGNSEDMRGDIDGLRELIKADSPFQVAIELMPKNMTFTKLDLVKAERAFVKSASGSQHVRMTRDFARAGFLPYIYAEIDEEGFDELMDNPLTCGIKQVVND